MNSAGRDPRGRIKVQSMPLFSLLLLIPSVVEFVAKWRKTMTCHTRESIRAADREGRRYRKGVSDIAAAAAAADASRKWEYVCVPTPLAIGIM